MPVLENLYPSRVVAEPEMIERRDPVVYEGGAASGRLRREDLESYERDGYLFVENLFGAAEIARVNQELHRLGGAEDIRRLEETITEPGADEVRSIFRVHQLSDLFDWLSRDARVLDVVQQILGGDVYLHQSRVNLKPGFQGKEFYWHSDFETWHVEDGMPRMRALSVSIALTQNYPFNGPLMLIPGSHKTYVSCVGETPENHCKESLKKQEYGVPDNKSLTWLADQGGIVAPAGSAGSAVFFDCNMMHGSNSNISPYPRSNAFFVYNSMENTLGEPLHGLKPRPEHIATRERFEALQPLERG
jgi:ectoine hydroxylase